MEKRKVSLEDLRKNNPGYLIKIQCPCCGYYTHRSDLYLFEICDVCCWEYDEVMHDFPDKKGGANSISLNEARENYKKHGISNPCLLGKMELRHPLPEEFPQNNS